MRVVLILTALYGLLALVAQPFLRRWKRQDDERFQATIERYRKQRDAECPNMIGKWGKP